MGLTMGGIAAVCFAIAIAFIVKKLAKRTVVFLMLITGVIGLGGIVGSIVTRTTHGGVGGATRASNALLGTGAGGLIVLAVLSIFIYPHIKPKGQPPTKFTPWLALIWGPIAAAVGGVFAAAAGLSSNIVAGGVSSLGDLVSAVIQGF